MTPTRTPKFTTFTHEDARVRKDNDLAGVRRAADVSAQPVQWLWPGRIPIGKVTLLVGDPGLGKSLIALDVGGAE
ncbi:MAG TPA: AAA family ATPase, partial [Lacipirellulaceae bacterium]